MRRILDEKYSVIILQSIVRQFLASNKVQRLRYVIQKQHELHCLAVSTIEAWYVRATKRIQNKLNGGDMFAQIRKLKKCIQLLQRVFRGFSGREKVAKIKIKNAVDWYAASKIQKIFRGSRVMHYKDLRMNFIAAFILDRHNIERSKIVEHSRMRYRTFLDFNRNDSASGSEKEEEKDTWVKSQDYKRGTYLWTNVQDGEVVFEEPYVPYGHEKALIGIRIR